MNFLNLRAFANSSLALSTLSAPRVSTSNSIVPNTLPQLTTDVYVPNIVTSIVTAPSAKPTETVVDTRYVTVPKPTSTIVVTRTLPNPLPSSLSNTPESLIPISTSGPVSAHDGNKAPRVDLRGNVAGDAGGANRWVARFFRKP